MPAKVGEFASAGLHDPKLIRLDAELKLNKKLKLSNIFCRTEEKYSILSYIFRHIFDSESEQTILFTATKYHVEFISKLLNELSIPNSYLYSSLNQGQRIKNMDEFRSGNSRVLVCTDVAARGVDIPELDNVLHFHFPSNGKTFIHRCGRTCRAGSSKGTSLSVLSPDEVPYAVEVMTYVEKKEVLDNEVFQIPHDEINVFTDIVNKKCNSNGDLEYLRKLATKSESKYTKSRGSASPPAVREAKILTESWSKGNIPVHPCCDISEQDEERLKFLAAIKNYSSRSTIFEINTTRNTLDKAKVMENKRKKSKINKLNREKLKENIPEEFDNLNKQDKVIVTKQSDSSSLGFVPEKEDEMMQMLKRRAGIKARVEKRWNGKKYVRKDAGNTKLMKTESGQKIKASFKNKKYEKWIRSQKLNVGGQVADDHEPPIKKMKSGKNEIKNTQQIVKFRKEKIKKMEKANYDKMKHKQRKNNAKKKGKK